jgi:hypothetical protein
MLMPGSPALNSSALGSRWPNGPLAGHALRFVATLVSPGAQIVAIGHSDPFVLV